MPPRQVPLPALGWLLAVPLAAVLAAAVGPGPFLGAWRDPVPGQLLALAVGAGLVAAVVAATVSDAVRRAPWTALLLAAYALAVAIPLVCGAIQVDRGAAVGRPTDGYAADARLVAGEPVRYLRHLDERAGSGQYGEQPPAALTHGPARTLSVWLADEAGASPGTAASVLLALVGGLAVPLLLVSVRSLAGELPARHLAPILVTMPGWALAWGSTDALVAAVGAGSLAWGVTGSARSRGLVSAAGAGLLLGALALFDYALVWGCAAALACTYFARRRPLLNLITATTALLPLALFSHAGFTYPDGLTAARAALGGRSYGDWVVAGVVALAIAAGPAVVGSAASLRRTAGWPLLVGGLVGVAAGLVLGLTRGGAERAWWLAALLLVTAASATDEDRRHTGWLAGVGGFTALVIAACFEPAWGVG